MVRLLREDKRRGRAEHDVEQHAPVAASAEPSSEAMGAAASAQWRANSRRLRNSLISLLVFCGLVVALLLAVPSLRLASKKVLAEANMAWIAAGIGLQVLSCAGYVLLFGLVFARLRRSMAVRLSLSELAINAVVSVGGLGGLALGAWVLRAGGAPVRRIAERSVLLFVLTSVPNFVAVVVFGVAMGLGLVPGSTNPLLTWLPAAAALLGIAATLALPRWADAVSERRRARGHDAPVALATVSEAVQDTVRMLRGRDPRVWGSFGYWLFNNLVLLVSFYAYGRSPAVAVVFMAYLLGMLANTLPIPGGFVAVEGGLGVMLWLYGVRPTSVIVAAVLTFRAISLWVPSLIGSVAFLSLRRELGQPLVLRGEPGVAEH
jgi:uncharacterized membrane protein YbhN (UPF0104 family)